MIGIEQALAKLSIIDLTAAVTGLFSLLIFIFALVKRGEIAKWEKEKKRLDNRLLDSTPEQEVKKTSSKLKR
jgi:hypothetical protein